MNLLKTDGVCLSEAFECLILSFFYALLALPQFVGQEFLYQIMGLAALVFWLFGRLIWGGFHSSTHTFKLLACLLLFLCFSVFAGLRGGFEVYRSILMVFAIVVVIALYHYTSSIVDFRTHVVAFAISGLWVSIAYIKLYGVDVLVGLTVVQRLSNVDSHPNLMGFCYLAYGCSSLFVFCSRRFLVRLISVGMLLLSVWFTYKSSSRGSLFSFFIIFGLIAVLMILSPWFSRTKFRVLWSENKSAIYFVLTGSFFLMVALFFYVSRGGLIIIYEGLRLGSVDAGLDSGFTGRADMWKSVFSEFGLVDFIAGLGFRSTAFMNLTIDNSYIVMLLENGLCATILFLSIVCSVLFRAVQLMRRRGCELLGIILFSVLLGFLANSFVARYLLGLGNPGSVFVLLLVGYSSGIIKTRVNIFNCRLGGRIKG